VAGGLRGNVCDLSLASWKARIVDFLWFITAHFLLALTDDALIASKSAFLKGWVSLGLNIRLNGYVYRQHLYTVR